MYSSANNKSLNMPTIAKSVLSERQTQYNPQDQVIIKISPGLGNMNPLESFLRFRVAVKNTGDMPFCAGLDGNAGAYSLFERVDIYSGLNAVHLESIQGVAEFMAMYSAFDNDKSTHGRRVLTEGYGGVAGTLSAQPVSGNSNGLLSNFYEVSTTNRDVNNRGCEYKDVEVVLPLYFSGIFNSNRIWSLMASDGLEIRITLRSASEAIRAFGEYGYSVGALPAQYPRPYDSNAQLAAGNLQEFGADTSVQRAYAIADVNNSGAPTGIVAGTNVNSVELMRTNNAALPANARGVNSLAQCPLLVGQQFIYKVDAPANTYVNLGVITGIQLAAAAPNNVELLFNNVAVAAGDDAAVANQCCGNRGGANIIEATGDAAALLSTTTGLGTVSITPSLTFELNDVEMVIGTVMTPPEYSEAMMAKVESDGGLVYEYPSWNLYRLQDNQAPRTSLLIPTLEARAKALVINPVRSTWGTGGQEFQNSALDAPQDSLQNYQFLLNNTLAPDLPIECLRSNTAADGGLEAWNDVAVQEAEKAMERADIKVNDLRNFHAHFTAGRRLSTDNHSYDAKSNEIRVNYQYLNTPKVQKQWFAQMSHIRRCVIKPDGIEVIY